MLEFANNVNRQSISLSFMIPQTSYQIYIEQILQTIQNIEQTNKQHIYIVLRVKSLGLTTEQQIANFKEILNIITFKRQQTIGLRGLKSQRATKVDTSHPTIKERVNETCFMQRQQISVILSGLFGHYNDLEYSLYIWSLDQGFQNIYLTIQANRSISEQKIKTILSKQGSIRLVKGYYKGDITDRQEIHNNYMKLARLLIQSNIQHILGTHNLIKVKQLYTEFPEMYKTIHLGYLYYINDYYQHQLTLNPELKKFNIIPQIQTSELSTLSVLPYTLDALKYWNYNLMLNLMGINKYIPKYQNIPKNQY